jgi:hypothetical protein
MLRRCCSRRTGCGVGSRRGREPAAAVPCIGIERAVHLRCMFSTAPHTSFEPGRKGRDTTRLPRTSRNVCETAGPFCDRDATYVPVVKGASLPKSLRSLSICLKEADVFWLVMVDSFRCGEVTRGTKWGMLHSRRGLQGNRKGSPQYASTEDMEKGRRATIKALPAPLHHPRPYGWRWTFLRLMRIGRPQETPLP